MNNIYENALRAKEDMGILVQNPSKIEDCLRKVATALRNNNHKIIAANTKDMELGREKGMHPGLLDRLALNEDRINAMAVSLEQVSRLPNPLGLLLEERELENGLVVRKISVPMGVIGIIYESRPNVTADAFGLCFKSGNAVILKGGSDAINSNIEITNIIRNVLKEDGINENVIQIIESTDREAALELMRKKGYVDVLIPRGGAGLIKNVVENSLVPVIETGTGNCHIYVDGSADISVAVEIINNAKTQRIGVCNACESLVVHKDIKDRLLPVLYERLKESNVEFRGDEAACDALPQCRTAAEEDFGKEYLDYIISIKTVDNVEEAIEHINKYSTGHSESIISKTRQNIDLFLQRIDSACVYANASTRFTDGFELGLGAEIGISTQKLHARGPMGLKELTTYKYNIIGKGQIRK